MITRWKAKRDIKPFKVTALDIETASNGDVLAVGFTWQSSDGERHYRAYHSWGEWYTDFWDIYKDSDRETRYRLRYIYAHNGAGFDWLSLIQWREQNNLQEKIEFITSGSFGIGAKMKYGNIQINLRDSMRLMPGNLKSLCLDFNTEHQKKEEADEYKDRMEDFVRDWPQLFWDYLRNDVLALAELVEAFWQTIYDKVGSIEMLPMTLPGLAMRLWRMTLSEDKPIKTPWNPKVKELERRAYTGGRTECFHAGIADVNGYDANSLYPTVMRMFAYPRSYAGGWTETYEGFHGLYEIEFSQTRRDVKPVLRDEQSKEFRYEGSGVYVMPEIQKLLEVGGEITVIKGWIFDDMEYIFRDFIDDWWATRFKAQNQGQTGLAYVCKILMNSLYGKFGQKEIGEKIVFWDEKTRQEEADKGTAFIEKGNYCVVFEERKSETTFVGIAAYVTAYARLHLYEKIFEVETKGGTVWYCDTDSVYVEGCEVETGKGLGEWKREKPAEDDRREAVRIAFGGKKLYATEDGEITAKGIGRNSAQKLTYADYERVVQSDEQIEVEFTVFPTNKEVLLQGKASSRPFIRKRTIRRTAPLKVAGDLPAD